MNSEATVRRRREERREERRRLEAAIGDEVRRKQRRRVCRARVMYYLFHQWTWMYWAAFVVSRIVRWCSDRKTAAPVFRVVWYACWLPTIYSLVIWAMSEERNQRELVSIGAVAFLPASTIWYFLNKSEMFQEMVVTAVAIMQPKLAAIVQVVVPIWNFFLAAVTGIVNFPFKVWHAIWSIPVRVWEAIKEVVVVPIWDFFLAAVTGIVNLLSKVWDAIWIFPMRVWEAIKEVVDSVSKSITHMIEEIVNGPA